MVVCDWQHMLEDGGAGGVIMAVVWGIVSWFKSRHPKLS